MSTLVRPSPVGKSGHIPALDGVRGLAIILVLFVHFVSDSAPRGTLELWLTKLAKYGAWGVDLFFVLSAFLITGILCDAKSKPHYFRNFYVRRTLRIFPLYYGVLVALFLIWPLLPVRYPAGLSESFRQQAWLWPYASNIYVSLQGSWDVLPYVSHFWSLAVEEHFYLAWPLVVFVCTQRTLVRVCVGAAIASLCLRSALSFAGSSDVALVALTPCRLDALSVGALLAVGTRTLGLKRLGSLALPALLGFSLLVVGATFWNATVGAWPEVVLPLRGTLVALAFGALLISSVVAPDNSTLGRVFSSRPMRFFGKYSYGIYVFHFMVATGMKAYAVEASLGAALGSPLAGMAAQALLGVGGSVLLAVASYELFEKHFLRLKTRLAPSEGELPAPALTRTPQLV
jgi:peptidoglycan/LPS O-acetylase OafA/YrhL